MTYPEDVLKAAREAAAQHWESVDCPEVAKDCRAGLLDRRPSVISGCIAILAERQRCTGIADAESRDARQTDDGPYTDGMADAADAIKAAILSPQENAGE